MKMVEKNKKEVKKRIMEEIKKGQERREKEKRKMKMLLRLSAVLYIIEIVNGVQCFRSFTVERWLVKVNM